MSAKKNSILNYFTKKSVSGDGNQAKSAKKSTDDEEDERRKKSQATSSKRSSQDSKHKSKLLKKSPKDKAVPLTFNSPYKVGDLVWAKLQGYPWWPSVVCEHPTGRQFCKWDGNGNCQEFHVQFIDKPLSRAWIKEKYVKLFKLNDSSISKSADPKWHRSLKEAEKAWQLSPEERLTRILAEDFMSEENCQSSNNEDVQIDDSQGEEDTEENANKRKNSSPDSEDRSKSAKRPRKIIFSDSSEDEYKPKSSEESESVSSGVSEPAVSESEAESPPVKKKKKQEVNGFGKDSKCSSPAVPRLSQKTKSLLSSFSANDSMTKSDDVETKTAKEWIHLTLDFLKPDKLRDAEKRPIAHPDYDSKTIHVPDSYKKTLTPALKQWWEVKSQHFDTVLFFKVGKFYELYHMDAVIGVNELNLIFMKGEVAHSGFPEIAYGRYAASLVERGFKVARVEQTETPAMMENRCKKLSHPSKFDKVVKRELCQITSKGTKKYGVLDAQSNESNTAYLLAVTEQCLDGVAGNEYGVCFIDTSLGTFHVGQFKDDRYSSRFRTLVARYNPVQVLYERRCLSTQSLHILKSCVSEKLVESLLPKSQFWDATKTLTFLAEGSYFKDSAESSKVSWPHALRTCLAESDSLGLTAKKDYEKAIKALGAVIWYLRSSCMEDELLKKKNFEIYQGIELASRQLLPNKWNHFQNLSHMILDGITLKNLDVLQNSGTDSIEGSLISKLDYCSTVAGKRLLRHLLCAPLLQPAAINDRLDAVEDLIRNKEVADQARALLKKLPDLERLISKIHSMGYNIYNEDHPDHRAIFYEEVTYSKRKILDFISTLAGFKIANEVIALFEEVKSNFKSRSLKRCVTFEDEGDDSIGKYPRLTSLLEFLENSFDQEKAKKDGKIIPSPGVDLDYDDSIEVIKQTTKELDSYLEKQCKLFGCKVVYNGTGRNRYQIEVPDRAVSKATNKHELQGQRKGFKRYWTSEVKEMLQTMMAAEDKRDNALRVVMSKIFILFSKDCAKWEMAVTCIANVDILLSLAYYSEHAASSMCRPQVIIPTSQHSPFLKIVNGRHPCIVNVFRGGEFIPNDTFIGSSEPEQNCSNLIMLTGPNMGGKSTLLRQIGLITIIAQLGCYVPADECVLTPVDRIFTRLGANDRITMGESTFFVELSETSATLQHASQHSLILMDELGRGTSTYDGMAIAFAVVKYFSTRVLCRTLFSTHYHHLVQNFLQNSRCQLSHMACLVENENDDDPTQETITFLYKLAAGSCPKSYGFNAAKLAGLPQDVIRVAYKKAKELEENTVNKKIFRSVFTETLSKNNLLSLVSI